MHKQKVITKWLTIIFLMTVAVANYIFLNTLFKNADGNAFGGDVPSTPTVLTPYFNDLPRRGEVYQEIETLNIGSSKNDCLLQSLKLTNSLFIFFSSEYADFDVKKSGINLAIIAENTLTKISHLSDDGEFVDVKYCGNYVAVAIKNKTEGILLKLNLEGDIIAKNNVPAFQDAKFYILSENLLFYSIQNGFLTMCEIEKDFTLKSSTYIYEVKSCKIIEIFKRQAMQFIVLNHDNFQFSVVTFDKISGFNEVLFQPNASLTNIFTLPFENSFNYYIFSKSKNGFLLQSYSENFSLRCTKTISATSATATVQNDIITIITPFGCKKLCKHLDIVSESVFKEDLGLICKTISISNKFYVCSAKNELFTVSELDQNLIAKTKLKISNCREKICVNLFANKVYLQISSRSIDGCCYKNFGGYDIFNFVI